MRLRADFVRFRGRFCGVTVSGHATRNDRDAAGKILCAAVSSAVQLTCNTLTECFGAPEQSVRVAGSTDAQNQISVRLKRPTEAQSEVLRGLLIHLEELAKGSRRRLHIRVQELGSSQADSSQSG